MSQPNPAEEFFGGLFVEVFVGGIFYGITTLQTFIYFQKYPDDGLFLKCFVAAVWFLETLHTGFCIEFVYSYVISNFGDVEYFIHINWGVGASLAILFMPAVASLTSLQVTVILAVTLSAMVQGFYIRRVWILSNHNWFLAGIISFLVVCRVAFGMGSTILTYYLPGWVSFRQHTSALVTVSGGLASVAAVDVLVTLSITWYLSRKRNEVQESAKSRVDMIMLYAVNSGALTATSSVITCILYAVRPHSLVFLGLVEVSGKLYANSFLGSLNARSHIRGMRNGVQYSHESSGNTYRGQTVPKVEVFQQTLVSKDPVDREFENDYSMKNMKGGDFV